MLNSASLDNICVSGQFRNAFCYFVVSTMFDVVAATPLRLNKRLMC